MKQALIGLVALLVFMSPVSTFAREWDIDRCHGPNAFHSNTLAFNQSFSAFQTIKKPDGENLEIPFGAVIDQQYDNRNRYFVRLSSGVKDIHPHQNSVRSFYYKGRLFKAIFSADKYGKISFKGYETEIKNGEKLIGKVDLEFFLISEDIKENGYDRFIHHINKKGPEYFVKMSKRFPTHASGVMGKILDFSPAAEQGTHISQWTHTLIADGTDRNNHIEHFIGMFLMSSEHGTATARSIGLQNEIRGLVINDRQSGRIIDALSGESGTAFEWKDLTSNEVGILLYEKWLDERP